MRLPKHIPELLQKLPPVPKKVALAAGVVVFAQSYTLLVSRTHKTNVNILLREYFRLWKMQQLMRFVVNEYQPDIWGDDRLQEAAFDYEFAHLTDQLRGSPKFYGLLQEVFEPVMQEPSAEEFG